MEADTTPHVVALDRVHDGLYLYFSNGRQALYRDALLYSILDQAEDLPDEQDDNDLP